MWAVAACCVAGTAVVACGTDDASHSGPTTTATAGRTFFGADGYPNWAATESWLVGFSGSDTDRPDVVPRYAARPIAGGPATELHPPEGHGRFEPTAVIGNRDTAVVLGILCGPGSADGGCPPGPMTGFLLDPLAQTWAPLELPEGAAATPTFGVDGVQPTEDGWLVVARNLDGTTNSLFHVSDDAVRLVSTSIPTGRGICVMGAHAYVLSAAPQGSDAMGEGTLRLTRTALNAPSAPTEPVELPPVSAAVGGIAVQMACDDARVYVTSAQPVPGNPMPAVHAYDGEAWSPQADLVPSGATIAVDTLSSPDGAAIVWSTTSGDDGFVALTNPNGPHRIVEAPGGEGQWQDHTGTIVFTPSDFGRGSQPLPSIDAS